ncbi:hypothetical protein EYF80_012807 [Liparis tanakae]|uniref:Uncharacterized protein n=1 Tax=Liparis tanakae TaxID=230148 RepID=A0A4Z2IGW8_9TELE|nr:hypothetical protein EYF80_012807 [Liparis tanakae]
MTFPSVSRGEAAVDARRDYTPVQEHHVSPPLSLSLAGLCLKRVPVDELFLCLDSLSPRCSRGRLATV